MMFTVQLA